MSLGHASEPAAALRLKGFRLVGLDVTGLRKLDLTSVKLWSFSMSGNLFFKA